MNDLTLTHLLDTASVAAQAAGKHALKNKHRRNEVNASFAHDIKLVLDVECQQIAEEAIRAEFPDHHILGEESVEQSDSDGYQWVIDPIDGTLNFSHGFSYWCCSVAVRYRQKVLAGCVFAPEYDEYYTAHIESPAMLNGEALRVSDTARLEDALIFTGLSKYMETPNHPHFEMFKAMAFNSRKVHINGAAALDLCNLAAGRCDAFFESHIYLWDYAAAGLIAEQAGASLALYEHKGAPFTCRVLCTNGKIHKAMQALYGKSF